MTRLRYGIVGLGRIALRQHLPVLASLPEAEVVALCDERPERATLAEEIVGGPLPFTVDYRELVEREDVDVVLIATPNDSHARIATAALQADKHVFLEKPMATTLEDAQDLVDLQVRTGKVLQVGYVLRHARFFRTVHELVQDGAIGEPRIAYLHEFRKPLPTPWRYLRESSGGIFVEKNCHHFDLFNWILGQRPRRASAFGGQAVIKSGMTIRDNHDEVLHVPLSEIPDHAVANLAYDGGAHASLIISFIAPFAHRLEFGVQGDGGLLVADQERLRIEIQDATGSRFIQVQEDEDAQLDHLGSVAQHREFLQAVRGEGPVYCDARLGFEGLVPGFLAQASLETGRIAEAVPVAGAGRLDIVTQEGIRT